MVVLLVDTPSYRAAVTSATRFGAPAIAIGYLTPRGPLARVSDGSPTARVREATRDNSPLRRARLFRFRGRLRRCSRRGTARDRPANGEAVRAAEGAGGVQGHALRLRPAHRIPVGDRGRAE